VPVSDPPPPAEIEQAMSLYGAYGNGAALAEGGAPEGGAAAGGVIPATPGPADAAESLSAYGAYAYAGGGGGGGDDAGGVDLELPRELASAQAAIASAPDEAAAADARERMAYIAKNMQAQFGWSESDCIKFLDKVKNVGNASAPAEEKPLVASLDEAGREAYALTGGSSFQRGGTAFDTGADFSKFMGGGWAIFVMSSDGVMYAGSHKVGLFHHSSFLAGGEVAGAGEIKASGGRVTALTNKSGHYRPTGAEMLQVFDRLQSSGVSLSSVDYFHIGENFHGKPVPAEGGAKGAYDFFKVTPLGTPPAKGASPAPTPAVS
jgi:hypothetical protein